jgi:adenylate kinase family enzyme
MDNVNGWNEVFGDSSDVLCVIHLTVSDLDICTERILERAKTSGRSDDTKEIIEKRFNTFKKENENVIGYFKEYFTKLDEEKAAEEVGRKNILIEVDCNKPVEDVFAQLTEKIDKILSV